MGRNKEPVNLLIAKGKKHLTKEEIERRQAEEIHAPADAIAAPSYLTKRQREKFYDIAGQLISLDIMANLDCEALARYITSQEMYEKITKKLRSREIIDDIYLLKEYSAIQDRYFRAARSAAGDLGLTITSRCKIVVPKSEAPPSENKFAMFNDN